MIIQSIGYRRFYWRLFKRVGIRWKTEFTRPYLRSENKQKGWRKLNRKKTHVKIVRMRRVYRKIREGTNKFS